MKTVRPPEIVLYPSSVVLVTSSYQGKDNIITLAWISTACFDPPLVACAIRDTRYSHGLIKNSKEFVLNIPSENLVRETDYCGQVSGRTVDKFAACKFTRLPGSKVKAPLIQECPVNIECTVTQIVHLGTHDLFIGEVVAVDADEDVVEENSISFEKLRPLAYTSGDYWTLGNSVGKYGFSKKS
ncbi:MAG: flavin reductase family protein [Theionarchaea archaeon]|nr:flavin reductase family protein [Theionarchaea archaeon]MBU7038753.1 flavin reductase family protein [Theionarchaea archaeon]